MPETYGNPGMRDIITALREKDIFKGASKAELKKRRAGMKKYYKFVYFSKVVIAALNEDAARYVFTGMNLTPSDENIPTELGEVVDSEFIEVESVAEVDENGMEIR